MLNYRTRALLVFWPIQLIPAEVGIFMESQNTNKELDSGLAIHKGYLMNESEH